MLLEAELLTEKELEQVLLDHKQSNLKLNKFLVRQGIVKESDVVDLICKQSNIAKYTPNMYDVNDGLASIIPSEVAQKHQVVPLDKKNNLIVLGMTDPMDVEAMDAIETLTNSEVEPVMCTESELARLINVIYGAYSVLGGVMESMDTLKLDGSADFESMFDSIEDIQVDSLQDTEDSVPVIHLVNSIISHAVKQGASDIHLSPEKEYVQMRFRIDGVLNEVPAPPQAMLPPILSRIKILSNMDIAKSRVPQDGRLTVKIDGREINIRCSVIPTIYGENLVMRLLDMSANLFDLDILGMSKYGRTKIEEAIVKPYGMILSTGPTGSGKSTSLYSILKKLNKPKVNIITIEDPVEYRMEKICQIQLNKRAGMTFASGLRAILRQDPDIVMVGEVRDSETAGLAIRASLTGHRVFSTVHTNDSAGAITRLLDLGIEPFLISSVLLVSFAQRLVRTICPVCSEPYEPPENVLAEWGLDKAENANFRRGAGCYNCMHTGYKGRVGIFEILVIDDMVQDMILKRCSAKEITMAAKKAGTLKTLQDDAASKVLQGVTTIEEAASAVII